MEHNSLFYIIVFVIGIFAGILNVVVGGGSGVIVPALILMGIPPHVAVASNRFAMLFNNFTGAVEYRRKGFLDIKTASLLSIFPLCGAIFGAFLVLNTSPVLLIKITAIVLLMEAIIAAFGDKNLGLTGNNRFEFTGKNIAIGAVAGFLIGTYGGFLGAAMTTMVMFILVYFFRFRFLESVAVSKVITFVISLFASAVFIFKLKVDFALGPILAAAYILGAYLGVHSAIKLGNRRIKFLFVAVAVILAVKLLL